MLRTSLFIAGLLISPCLSTATEAATINTNLNSGFKEIMLAQFSPTQNQRQQDAFNRDANNYQAWLHYQRQQRQQAEYKRRQKELARIERIKQIRESIPELESKKDYLALGLAWHTLGEWDRSLDATEKAIVAYPNVVRSYILRASLRERLNDVPGALADYNQAIIIEPDFHGYYRLRGKLKKGFDRNGAVQDFRTAIKIIRVDERFNLVRDSELKLIIKELQSLGLKE
jgi:tetratricopeptide (TPR) repeat protein